MDRYDQLQRELHDALWNLHQASLSCTQAELDWQHNKQTFSMVRRQVQSMQRELAKLDQRAARGLCMNGIAQ